MRAVIQRVSKACVKIDGKVSGEIDTGLVVLLAVNNTDTYDTVEWFSNKLANLRIFPDNAGKMNKSVLDCNGGILLVSNFTVYGDANKGFRPSFIEAAHPDIAEPLYNEMISYLKKFYPIKIETGVFGAMMDIELVNDGPVTIIIEK